MGPCFCPQGTPENPGINQRALQLLFSEVQEKASDWDYTITVSAAEIYNEVLRWAALARRVASGVASWSSGPCRAMWDDNWSWGYMSNQPRIRWSQAPVPTPGVAGRTPCSQSPWDAQTRLRCSFSIRVYTLSLHQAWRRGGACPQELSASWVQE